ncbi:hypothetical protein LWI29_033463 [Acer saccharum]|uniref:Uncharacterized protein n=1 Tax=Acer saccharum TaxID=4024 RepID=A0AA39UM04_ACESA|nr:hypothetical protein LWI29_033463 [Acer saccharum]
MDSAASPATSGVPPTPEVHYVSSSSSQPDSYQPEARSDSSASTCVDTRPWRRPGKRMSTHKIYKDSHSLESRVATQRIVENDIEEEHIAARIPFSPERICAYEIEPNMVGPEKITKYMRRQQRDFADSC